MRKQQQRACSPLPLQTGRREAAQAVGKTRTARAMRVLECLLVIAMLQQPMQRKSIRAEEEEEEEVELWQQAQHSL